MTETGKVRNYELYTNRTVQDWHRGAFNSRCWAIDLDLMGTCASCAQPLYLIEASTSKDKSTRILRVLAERADVPAYLVLHDTVQVVRAVCVHAGSRQFWSASMVSEAELRDELFAIRREHYLEHHPFAMKEIGE